jgi:hypothetical protein
MKNLKYLFLLPLGMVLAASCSDDDDDGAAGNPVLLVNGLAQSAQYGDSIFFDVACSDAEGVDLSTLKAYLEYSGEPVSSQVIRTKTEGTYHVSLYAPLYKAVPDGVAQVRLVLQNIRLAKTEQVVDLPLARPHYEYLTFVPATGSPVTLAPDAADPFLFTGSYTSANRTFKGYFVAPKDGEHGTELTFGQGNDDIKEGVTDAITMNGNKGANVVSFNVLTYAYGPTESDPNASTEIVLTKSDNVYVGELVQGHTYEFAGESIMNSSRWFYDSDWFVKDATAGTYTFQGITGTYNITADFTNLAFHIWVMDGTSSGTLKADGTGAIWIIGNNGVGKPSYTASNVQSWWTGEEHDYCLTPIAEKVHRISLTVGKQLNGADVNFKFFGQAAWGTEFKGSASSYHLSTDSDIFGIGDGNGHDDGNLYLLPDVMLTDGDTYVFTIDLTNGCSNGILTITKN